MAINPQAQELNEKIKKLNPSVFSMLSEKGRGIYYPRNGILVQTAEAKGKKINATIGMSLEDDGSPMCLDVISKKVNLNKEDVFSYANSYGRQDLREAWKQQLSRKNPSIGTALCGTPVVTCALTHGLSICGFLFGDAGEKLIMPDLYWPNYRLLFCNWFNLEIDTFETFSGKGFNTEGLREKLLSGETEKKLVLLNFPNNPTGYTPTTGEAEAIVQAIKEAADRGKKIVALIDDAYFGLIYEEGIYKESLFSKLAALSPNVLAVKIDGPTKEDFVWGFRVGFLTYAVKGATAELYGMLEEKTAGAIRGNISNAPNLSQALLVKAYAMQAYEKEKEKKFNILKNRYEHVKRLLKEKKEYAECFTPMPFNSGYFMCVKLLKADPETVRQALLKEYSTGVIATNNVLRIAYSSCPDSLIEELFDNIYSAVKKQ